MLYSNDSFTVDKFGSSRGAAWCGVGGGMVALMRTAMPQDKLIDNESAIDYDQLYAQLVKEVENGERYYFTNDEVMDIQQLNLPYYGMVDKEEIFNYCFSLPSKENPGSKFHVSEIVNIMREQYPALVINRSTTTSIGIMLRSMGLKSERNAQGIVYPLVRHKHA